MKLTAIKASFFVFLILFHSVLHSQTGDQHELDSLRKPIYALLESLWTVQQNILAEHKKTTDTLLKKELQNKIDRHSKTWDSLQKELHKIDIDFARRHLSSPVALQTLSFRLWRHEGTELNGVIDSIFRNMSAELKNSANGKIFQTHLSYFKNSAVGQPAPTFEGKDINANPLSLKKLQGKYVLLDFWASWCLPCRQDHPFLKDVYKKYNHKGLEIISISSDKELEKWKTAIQQDGTGQWKHFSSLENNINLEDIYYVVGIPVKVLIDKQGVIIARWLGGGEEEINQDMRKKFEEIFE